MADAPEQRISTGDPAPPFELPDTEGGMHSLAGDGSAATVVVFTCNHCPYALAWHDRLAAVARDYAGRGVRMLAVCSNDAERYPADSYEAMQARVREEGGWPMPYLHDATQEVARAYGAKTTPDLFVVDAAGAVRYRGAPDRDYGDPTVNAEWLRGALDAVLAGTEPDPAQTNPVGCGIKWKPS
jgi:peroxiredoxin